MSDIVEVIAKVIEPWYFDGTPHHGPGQCPDCDSGREQARKKARDILAALKEVGYHIETEFEVARDEFLKTEYIVSEELVTNFIMSDCTFSVSDRGEFPGWHGAKDLQLSP